MAPLAVNAGTTGQSGGKEGNAESTKSSDSSTSGGESVNRWSFGASPFATPGAPVYHPSIDMSSTQALINMVRTASAQSANQLETYLKGIKRGAENPLDLSATKKARKSGAGLSLSESLYGDALLGLPMLSALNRASKDLLPPTHRLQTKSPKPSKNHTKNNHTTSPASGQSSSAATTNSSNSRVTTSPVTTNPSVTNPPLTNSPVTSRPQCMSLCADKPCAANSANGALFGVSGGINAELAESGGSGTEMTSWTVEEVASFVGTIDICAEYAGNFRDQCIDGSALPLLTEAHLTTALQMKLGPALKLRSVLSRRLGNCAVCMHCVHCHGSQASLLTGPQALLQNPQASLLTGPQALLQNPQASLLTGPQALLQSSQASLLTGPQTLLQNPQASLLSGPQSSQQALSSTPQPPPSTPSPKPLTRPNSTGN
ncbi:sterile alpha motif domain-containing protein 11-like [Nilaparvata lugens]|uniref:sterile alpha motif domain-containing protein 11-like n=1 Tax=Nilaparvata lugens TaxID=108931 RepID=UPI00193E8551|nr:sterile alpha motif domain-containing protein 11-like [Nilaparvata lugens]